MVQGRRGKLAMLMVKAGCMVEQSMHMQSATQPRLVADGPLHLYVLLAKKVRAQQLPLAHRQHSHNHSFWSHGHRHGRLCHRSSWVAQLVLTAGAPASTAAVAGGVYCCCRLPAVTVVKSTHMQQQAMDPGSKHVGLYWPAVVTT